MKSLRNYQLPISFDEVSYFKNAFRGDLIITTGVIYYFPHINVEADKRRELSGGEMIGAVGGLGELVTPYLGLLPFGFKAANLGFRAFRFGRRTFRPTINRPKIREQHLWRDNLSNEILQNQLDSFIAEDRKNRLIFAPKILCQNRCVLRNRT